MAQIKLKYWAALSALVLVSAASVCSAQTSSFAATLAGGNEVPPTASSNTGTTAVTVDGTANTVSWNTVSSIPVANATGHHLHRGAAGVNGPVVVSFGVYSGTAAVTPALAAEILGNPSGFYVNLHTATFPGGEIRAQLVPFSTANPTVPTLAAPQLAWLALALAAVGAFVYRRSTKV